MHGKSKGDLDNKVSQLRRWGIVAQITGFRSGVSGDSEVSRTGICSPEQQGFTIYLTEICGLDNEIL